MTKLTMLTVKLTDDISQYDGVPNELQYERCIRDAISEYNQRAGRRKVTELSIVSGTDTYSLPADFVRLIRLAQPASYHRDEGVLITSDGLVPVGDSYEATFYVVGDQIVFYPTPTYSTTRALWYVAGHVLDASGDYAEMQPNEVDAILHLARAKALSLQANKAAQDAWQYALGDERVNKEKLAAALRAEADAERAAYEAALNGLHGPVGMRSQYDAMGR